MSIALKVMLRVNWTWRTDKSGNRGDVLGHIRNEIAVAVGLIWLRSYIRNRCNYVAVQHIILRGNFIT